MTAPDPTAGEREPYCTACLFTDRQCMESDGGCCDVCRATGGCSHTTDFPAVAASTGTSEDVEALAREVCPCSDDPDGTHVPDLDAGCGWALALCRAVLASDWLAAQKAAARAEEREALVVLDGLLHRWETVPALRRATAAAEVRRALGEHLARAAREAR